ncbi:hypothetical protein [Sedimentibacter sp.]|uniref:hypothetical protein n=1 Tax=Sedimentibacter sp. TaxID=1960295 RepID=UPI0028964892|nr:hypothetical protein [Sedimentibacter sp.]
MTMDNKDMKKESNKKETLYLTSIPGMKERLIEEINAEIKDCLEFEWYAPLKKEDYLTN